MASYIATAATTTLLTNPKSYISPKLKPSFSHTLTEYIRYGVMNLDLLLLLISSSIISISNNKVISIQPFKMKIGWLNSKTNSEFGPMEWVGSGFSKTCGEFKVMKFEINKSLNSFSHQVKWAKGARGILHIVPENRDIWALYRNWSLEWNEHTPGEAIHKYDMVQVVDDYSEERGASVTPLIKVDGFKTVFHPHWKECCLTTC